MPGRETRDPALQDRRRMRPLPRGKLPHGLLRLTPPPTVHVGCAGSTPGQARTTNSGSELPHFYENAGPCQAATVLRTMRLHFYTCSRHKRSMHFFRRPISMASSRDPVRARADGSYLSHRRKNSLVETNSLRPQGPHRAQQFPSQRGARHMWMLALGQAQEPGPRRR